MSNSLDPDQARHFVRPDLWPNCLQKSLVSKELTCWFIVKFGILFVSLIKFKLLIIFNIKLFGLVLANCIESPQSPAFLEVMIPCKSAGWSATWLLAYKKVRFPSIKANIIISYKQRITMMLISL